MGRPPPNPPTLITHLVYQSNIELGELLFLLNGTIIEHVTTSKQRYPESAAHIEEIEESLYVDDLSTNDAERVMEAAIRVSRDKKLKLHKWHSNVKELGDFTSATKPNISFEKQELRSKTSESNILGVSWNKVKDTFRVNLQVPDQPTTKKGILKFLGSLYDTTQLASFHQVILLEKDMCREA